MLNDVGAAVEDYVDIVVIGDVDDNDDDADDDDDDDDEFATNHRGRLSTETWS